MNRRALLVVLSVTVLSTAAAQKPADPASPETTEAGYKTSLAAAAEYEIRVGTVETAKPLELVREPKLKWSNPAMSDVQGNVFVWMRDGRPLVVGSLTKWFSPRSYMQH